VVWSPVCFEVGAGGVVLWTWAVLSPPKKHKRFFALLNHHLRFLGSWVLLTCVVSMRPWGVLWNSDMGAGEAGNVSLKLYVVACGGLDFFGSRVVVAPRGQLGSL